MSTPPNDPDQHPEQPAGGSTQPGEGEPSGSDPSLAEPPASAYQAAPAYEAGADRTRQAVARPKPLDLAVKLMYAGAALSLVSLLLSFVQTDAIRDQTREQLEQQGEQVTEELLDNAVTFGIVFGVLIGLLGAGLWVLMAVMNGKGKKWARVVATVLGALGILLNGLGLTGIGAGTATALSLVLSVVTILLAVAILVLLWNKENGPYYEAMSGPPGP